VFRMHVLYRTATVYVQLLCFFLSVLSESEHCHAPDDAAVRKGLLLKRLHEKMKINPTVPVRRLYDAAVIDDSGDSDSCPPAFHHVRSRLKRYRKQFVPDIPRRLGDVDIDGEWMKTWNGKQFLTYQDNYWGLAVFTTTRMLHVLQKSRCLYIDGTFRTAPHPYKQLLIVHGWHNGFIIPLVFCIAAGKSVGHYRQLLQHLKRAVFSKTGHRFRPLKCITDFEASLMTAMETEFPRCRLYGCYFHFCQSLWRHLQHSRLVHQYRTDASFRKCVRKVMAIAFLPVLLVRQNFLMFRVSRRVRRVVRRLPEFDDWLTYVEMTYVGTHSVFPPPVWNVYERSVDTRTNNHLEGTL